MLVGEQPADEEDLRGRPFTGPAGRIGLRAEASSADELRAALIEDLRRGPII
jgi:uracil-DNA glycosylase